MRSPAHRSAGPSIVDAGIEDQVSDKRSERRDRLRWLGPMLQDHRRPSSARDPVRPGTSPYCSPASVDRAGDGNRARHDAARERESAARDGESEATAIATMRRRTRRPVGTTNTSALRAVEQERQRRQQQRDDDRGPSAARIAAATAVARRSHDRLAPSSIASGGSIGRMYRGCLPIDAVKKRERHQRPDRASATTRGDPVSVLSREPGPAAPATATGVQGSMPPSEDGQVEPGRARVVEPRRREAFQVVARRKKLSTYARPCTAAMIRVPRQADDRRDQSTQRQPARDPQHRAAGARASQIGADDHRRQQRRPAAPW